jgi:arylsulfatase
MNLRTLLKVLLVSLLALRVAAESERTAAAADPPNIVFILADDMGYSDAGCYGSEIHTPNLDALAASGLRYTQFYNTARCWPTRAALLTGYYPQQIHRDALPSLPGGSQQRRQTWARLLPDLLRPAGYHCYHSGKWHVDGEVLAGGFERSLNVRNDGNFFTAKGNLLDDKPLEPNADERGYYTTIATVDHAIDCLQQHQQQAAKTPFFQYIAFIAPHFPLHALPEDIEKYRDRYLAGWDVLRRERHQRQQAAGLVNTPLSALETDIGPPYHFPEALQKLGPGEVNRPLPWDSLTIEQQRFQATKMAIHAAMVDRMDHEIGRYLQALQQAGQRENTLIFFASDNGASAEIMVRHGGHDPQAAPGSAASYLCLGPGFSSVANTPLRRHKTWVHEGGISSPLIVNWPKGIRRAGELNTAAAHMIDIVPTVMELAGLTVPDSWEGELRPPTPGKSLVPTFAANMPIPRDCLWWLHEGNRAVRVGDWKLVAAKNDPWELYNVASDRAEQTNLASQHPEKVRELEAVWQSQTDEFTALAEKTRQEPAQGRQKKKQQ